MIGFDWLKGMELHLSSKFPDWLSLVTGSRNQVIGNNLGILTSQLFLVNYLFLSVT